MPQTAARAISPRASIGYSPPRAGATGFFYWFRPEDFIFYWREGERGKADGSMRLMNNARNVGVTYASSEDAEGLYGWRLIFMAGLWTEWWY